MAAYTEGGHTERWSKRRGFSESGRMFEFVCCVCFGRGTIFNWALLAVVTFCFDSCQAKRWGDKNTEGKGQDGGAVLVTHIAPSGVTFTV